MTAAEEPVDLLAGMRDGAWLDAQVFPPLQYTVPGIVPEGFGLLVAAPKVGKSWFAANIGLAAAAGGKALGCIDVRQRPVLYLALEDGHRRLQERFRRITAEQPIPAAMHVVIRAKTFEVIGMMSAFLERNSGSAPLVILDTLGKVKPPRAAGADPYQADYAVGSQLKDVADAHPGATLLAVHHSRKAESADFVDASSGTQGLAGSTDFMLVLTRKRHQDDAVLAVTGRDVSEAEYAVRSDAGLWRLDGRDLTGAAAAAAQRKEQGQLGDRALEVMALVNRRAAVGDCTRAGDLAELGITQEQARVYLNRLSDGGRIAKLSRGLYRGVTTVTSVTSEGQNETHITDITHLFDRDDDGGEPS